MIHSDKEAEMVLSRLLSLEITSDEEWSIALDDLESYVSGVSEILVGSKVLLTPQEILRLAREKSKPILL